MKNNINKEKGNILISSLFILIAMNLLGAGIMQNSTRDLKIADFKFVDAEIYHLAESCVHDIVTQFETFDRKPDSQEEDGLNISDLTPDYLSTGDSKVQTKLQGFAQNCNITFLGITKMQSGVSGTEISSQTGEYNSAASSKSVYYYRVTSTGTGPEDAEKIINSIISVTF
jgi:hypothetical protein